MRNDARSRELTKKAMAFDLTRFVCRGGPEGAQHFYNAHFPGLYSIVIGQGCYGSLRRLFIAPPGQLAEDLRAFHGRFLWHAHAYSFAEVTIAGAVTNLCIRPELTGRGSAHCFYEYEIHAGITTGRRPTLKCLGHKFFEEFRHDHCREMESFGMNHDIIHRVVFHPNPDTGWFACLVQEYNAAPAPPYVYCESLLSDVPHADELYKKITSEEAQDIVRYLCHAQDLKA